MKYPKQLSTTIGPVSIFDEETGMYQTVLGPIPYDVLVRDYQAKELETRLNYVR